MKLFLGDFIAIVSRSNKLYIASIPHGFMAQRELVTLAWYQITKKITYISFGSNSIVCVTMDEKIQIYRGFSREALDKGSWLDVEMNENVR